jgi:hypothetical protein
MCFSTNGAPLVTAVLSEIRGAQAHEALERPPAAVNRAVLEVVASWCEAKHVSTSA